MTDREVMQQALEALRSVQDRRPNDETNSAMIALREVLEAQHVTLTDGGKTEREPVAWMWRCKPYCNWPEWSVSLQRPADSGCDGNKRTEGYEDIPLYTAAPQRQPLTDEQIHKASTQAGMHEHYMGFHSGFIRFARAIEAAHGIGGQQ